MQTVDSPPERITLLGYRGPGHRHYGIYGSVHHKPKLARLAKDLTVCGQIFNTAKTNTHKRHHLPAPSPRPHSPPLPRASITANTNTNTNIGPRLNTKPPPSQPPTSPEQRHILSLFPSEFPTSPALHPNHMAPTRYPINTPKTPRSRGQNK
jgi:hypothetical protein